ncbi:MAG TPA: phage holin family protein [Segetibacter sp.]|jgi:membrane protein YdbS with pleckstrin-like domain
METERKNFFEETRELATKYIDDRLLLIKLQAAEKAAKFSSMLFKAIVVGVIFFFILSIISFLIGYYLSLWTGSFLLGFGILVVIYIIILLVILSAHKKYLHKKIVDKMIELFFRNTEDTI